MRIFHICDIQTPSSGIYTVLMNLIPVQKSLGNEVRGINVDRKGVDNGIISYLSYADFKALITSERPDIVIIHSIFYKEVIQFSHYLRKKKIPYAIQLHGALSKKNMQTSRIKKIIVNHLFLYRILQGASGVIYLNKGELKNSTVQKFNACNVIIPNGCDSQNSIAKHNNETLELIFLSRLDKDHKGLDVLIPALKECCIENLPIHISIYGGGDTEEVNWLKRQIVGFENKISYHGEVYGEKKMEAYLKSDYLLLTSRYEGFPMTVLEALSVGLPCIITRETNVSDIIEEYECGEVVSLDSKDIKSCIEKVSKYSRKYIRSLSSNCVKAAANFTWDKIGIDSLAVYRHILNFNEK